MIVAKKRSIVTKVKNLPRRAWAFVLRSKGFSGQSAKKWTVAVRRNRKIDAGFDGAQKKQAYKWGFMPRDVAAFAVTDNNRDSFISERDYLYCHPMNGKYDKWIRNRISALNVFYGDRDIFETCHFHIMRRTGETLPIPMSAQAREVNPSIEGLHSFLMKHGSMAVTSTAWSKSKSWRISAAPEGFVVEGEVLTFERFQWWIEHLNRRYDLVIVDDSFDGDCFADIAPEGDATVRVLMINGDGTSPRVAQAMVQLSCDASLFEQDSSEIADGDETDASADEDSSAALFAPSADEESADGILGTDARGANELAAAVNIYTSHIQGEEDVESLVDAEEMERLEELRLRRLAKAGRLRVRRFFSSVDADGCFKGLVSRGDEGLVRDEMAPFASVAFAGRIPGWSEIERRLSALCRRIPQVEFAEFELRVSNEGFVIVGIKPMPQYNRCIPFSPIAVDFLKAKIDAKRAVFADNALRHQRFWHNLRLKIRRKWASAIAIKGLVPYQSIRWVGDMRRDLFSRNGVSLPKKLWAYRYGFLSYRLDQYGIAPENRREFISDFEYRWLRHINSRYRYWLEDKITLKYIASEYGECFPDYYYYTSLKGGRNRIIPMMDLPEGYGATADDVLRLARERQVLALKPDEGSHGEGFYRLAWENGGFTLNGEDASEEDVLAVLENPANQYLITEYILMHPDLKRIYPEAVNTVRVTVFKRDGHMPIIGNAYMRIGSSRSGFVDNLAAGGIGVAVDVATGRFGDAKMLDGVNMGNLIDCHVHPDTGVPIEGVLPNWEYAKQKIIDIALTMPELEYFGFDIAITADGIKIPEINRFPDFPRIDILTPETIEYLLYKLERKKHVYGYDVNRTHKPIRLPER